MSSSEPPKWKRFEELAAHIQRKISPNAKITTNERIMGKRTKTPRQVDICVRQSAGQFDLLIVIDCKDYKHPLDVKDVETFLGLLTDVGANKGAMIAANGFTSAAKIRAEDAGVDLYRLVDAQANEWRAYVTAPCLIRDDRIHSFSLTFNGIGPARMKPTNFKLMPLYRETGEIIDYIHNLVLDRWEDQSIPKNPGEYEGIPLIKEDAWANTDGQLYKVNVSVNVKVVRKLFFGQLPIVDVQGFSDEIKGGIITNYIKTDIINFERIEKEWLHLEKEEELAVRPVITINVSSTYPRLQDMSKRFE